MIVSAPLSRIKPEGRTAAKPEAVSQRLLTVQVPFRVRARGGRVKIVAPDGQIDRLPAPQRADQAMVKAVARGFRWRKLIETGACASVADIARAEKISDSYVSRHLRLTLLSPAIVEAILDGRQPATVTLPRLLSPFPIEWSEQFTAAGPAPDTSSGHAAE
jgi:hypothetical protein